MAFTPSLPRASLRDALAIEARVIGAIIMRELHTRFGRDNIGYLWMFVDPALLATGVTAVHFLIHVRLPFHMDIAPFYICGYTTFLMFRTIVNRAASTVEANKPLLYHRHVTLFNLCVGRSLLDYASATLTLFTLLAAVTVMGLGHLPDRPLIMFEALGLVLWLGWSLSMILAAAGALTETIDKFVHPGMYLIMPFSGVFFVVDTFPGKFRDLLLYIPLVHCLELVRVGEFGGFDSPFVDVPYVVAWCAGMTLVGIVALRAVRPHLEVE
jgi:capsular polysaccharide transport system permease protein